MNERRLEWITEQVAVGGVRDLLDCQSLEVQQIEAVLQLYGLERERAAIPLPLEILPLQVMDRQPLSPEALREGVDFLRRQLGAGRKVLVACGAGMSRSPVFVAACLHEEGMDLLEAFRMITRARPGIRPHPALVRSLVEYYRLPRETGDLLVDLARSRRGSQALASPDETPF